jgi:hypothetical protein
MTNRIAKENIVSEKQYSTLLNSVSTNSKKTREVIQQASEQALLYANFHDNYDRASALMLVVITDFSPRVANQLRVWFETFGPFGWRKTEDKNFPDGMKFRKSNAKDAPAFDLQKAFDTPWYTIDGFTAEETQAMLERVLEPKDLYRRLKNVLRDAQHALHEETAGSKVFRLENPTEQAKEVTALIGELTTMLESHGVDLSEPTVKETEQKAEPKTKTKKAA